MEKTPGILSYEMNTSRLRESRYSDFIKNGTSLYMATIRHKKEPQCIVMMMSIVDHDTFTEHRHIHRTTSGSIYDILYDISVPKGMSMYLHSYCTDFFYQKKKKEGKDFLYWRVCPLATMEQILTKHHFKYKKDGVYYYVTADETMRNYWKESGIDSQQMQGGYSSIYKRKYYKYKSKYITLKNMLDTK